MNIVYGDLDNLVPFHWINNIVMNLKVEHVVVEGFSFNKVYYILKDEEIWENIRLKNQTEVHFYEVLEISSWKNFNSLFKLNCIIYFIYYIFEMVVRNYFINFIWTSVDIVFVNIKVLELIDNLIFVCRQVVLIFLWNNM